LLPWACATDITDSETEAAVITAMAALRMFNIFNSPLDVIVAPGRDAPPCRSQRLLMMRAADAAIYSRPTTFSLMTEDRKIRRDRAAHKPSATAMVSR
jgi:hypothetical protein